MLSHDGTHLYNISPDTRCFGACIDKGQGMCGSARYAPFFIRDPRTNEKINSKSGTPATIRRGAGESKRCKEPPKDDKFITFPVGASATDKANLLGANFFLKAVLLDLMS